MLWYVSDGLEHVEHGGVVPSHALFPLACPLIKEDVFALGREMAVCLIEIAGPVEVFLPYAVHDFKCNAYFTQHVDAFGIPLAAVAGPYPEISPDLVIVGMFHRSAVFEQEIPGVLVVPVPEIPPVGYRVADGKQHLQLVGIFFRMFMEPDIGPLSDSTVFFVCGEMSMLLEEVVGGPVIFFPY